MIPYHKKLGVALKCNTFLLHFAKIVVSIFMCNTNYEGNSNGIIVEESYADPYL